MAINKQSKWTSLFGGIVGLGIIILLLYGLYYVYLHVRVIFSGLPKEILAPIIAGSFTIIASFITVSLGRYLERKSVAEQEHRAKKAPLYQELVNFVLRTSANNGEDKMSEDEQLKFLLRFTETLLIWGSSDVINKWSIFRKQLIDPDPSVSSIDSLFLLENVLLAIRKDMGHKHSNFKKGDILCLFVNDIRNFITK